MPGPHWPCALGAVPFRQQRLSGTDHCPGGQRFWQVPSSATCCQAPQVSCVAVGRQVRSLHHQLGRTGFAAETTTSSKPAGHTLSGDFGHFLQLMLLGAQTDTGAVPFQQVPGLAPPGPGGWKPRSQASMSAGAVEPLAQGEPQSPNGPGIWCHGQQRRPRST